MGKCHSLITVNVSRDKLVSDIGISSLAVGCPKLISVVCDHLFLLTDPRLLPCQVSKGSKLSGGLSSVVGVAALAQFCPHLQRLSLIGCFQINTGIQKHLSTLKFLKEINLTGCNKISKLSLIQLSQSCVSLESINLTDCGSEVDNLVLDSIGNGCKLLQNLVLARCGNFSCLKALSRCEFLTNLDLSGCSSITDLSLLPLCEDHAAPRLSQLHLVDIKAITSSSMAWIAFGCKKLILLSIKGTRIDSHSARAVRESFPYSTLVKNTDNFGYYPISRWEERRLINSYSRTVSGIVKFQALCRGFLGRRKSDYIRKDKKRDASVLTLQCLLRIARAKKELKRRQIVVKRIDFAAVRVVSLFRMAIGKRRASLMRCERELVHLHKRATQLQVRWLILCARRRLRSMRLQAQLEADFRVLMAVVIQSAFRRKFARNYVIKVKYAAKARQELRVRKATIIARIFRGYRTRIRLLKNQRATAERETILKSAARKIQVNVRSRRLRGILEARGIARKTKILAVIRIQAVIRRCIAKILVTELRDDFRLRRQQLGACRIQSAWKIKRAYNELQRKRRVQDEYDRRRHWAATQFTKYIRSKQVHEHP